MATLREIKRHIAGVTSIQKITRAMKMVAAAKLRRAQERTLAARPYAIKLDDLLSRLVLRTNRDAHPLLVEREPQNVALVVVTSDRGLCGSFNSNILRRATAYVGEYKDRQLHYILLGRKGRDFFKKRYEGIIAEKVNFIGDMTWSDVEEIVRLITDHFLEMKLDRIDILYNEFKSASLQRIVIRQFLPLVPSPIHYYDSDASPESPAGQPESMVKKEYLFEPDVYRVLDELIPLHLQIQVWRILLESFAAEMGSRMVSMEAATENASELIQSLTLHYNKARQNHITRELLDIVGGAEGLT